MTHRFYSLFLLCLLILPKIALAGSTTGLPWEEPLTMLANSLTGPVAITIAIIGIFAAGAMMMFGGEISHFVRTIVYLVLVAAVLVLAGNMITILFGVSGALI